MSIEIDFDTLKIYQKNPMMNPINCHKLRIHPCYKCSEANIKGNHLSCNRQILI